MKKIIAVSVLVATLATQLNASPITMLYHLQGIHSSFSTPDQLKETLMKNFPDAQHVSWEKNGDYFVAKFNTDTDRLTAYFSEDAELYKVTRFIECRHLPLTVQRALNERYDLQTRDKTIMEVTRGTETYYLVSFELDNKQIIVESNPSGNLQVIRKTKI